MTQPDAPYEAYVWAFFTGEGQGGGAGLPGGLPGQHGPGLGDAQRRRAPAVLRVRHPGAARPLPHPLPRR